MSRAYSNFASELVRLVSHASSDEGQTSELRVPPGVFKGIYNRWQVERKVKKVLYER